MADLREAESLAATGAATNARVADMADIVPRVCEQTRTCAAGVVRARVALGSRECGGVFVARSIRDLQPQNAP